MKSQHLVWAAAAVCAATCMAVVVAAVEANAAQYPGGGSHGHMKQHQHGKGHGHRHHVPQRPPPRQINDAADRDDPKRMLKETLPNPKLLQDNDIFHDKEHLKEELPEYLNLERIQEMSDRELDFHYFRMHDFDNNYLLDGLELLAALGHVIEEEEEEEEGEEQEAAGEGKGEEEMKRKKKEESVALENALRGLSEEEKEVVRNFRYQKWEESWKFYIELVDGVLDYNDLNKDGFISWSEFLKGRNRDI